MQNKDIDIISLNMSKSLLKDRNGEIIYPGDLLIRSNSQLEFIENQFNYSAIEKYILKDEFETIIPFIESLPPYSFTDDISVAEYFNIDIKNIKNPILGLHGSLQSLSFNINQNFISINFKDFNQKYTKFTKFTNLISDYKHLNEDELDKYRIGIISTNEFSKNEKTIDLLIKKLKSKFAGNVEILKAASLKSGACISEKIIFKYRIKDMISYKKAKKIQKGVFERLNWYEKYDKIMFPYLYYFYKDKNIFEMALNENEIIQKYKNSVEMLNDYFQILYHFERNEGNHNHKNFSIFCKKHEYSNKKIYFFKGKN